MTSENSTVNRVIIAAPQEYLKRLRESNELELTANGLPVDVVKQVMSLAPHQATVAYWWTAKTVGYMARMLQGSIFTYDQCLVLAVPIVRQAWTGVVSHPGSTNAQLSDPQHASLWMNHQTTYLRTYRLRLPNWNPTVSLQILRAGLVTLDHILH